MLICQGCNIVREKYECVPCPLRIVLSILLEEFSEASQLTMQPSRDNKGKKNKTAEAQTAKLARKKVKDSRKRNSLTSEFKDPLTEQELTNAIMQIDPNKAPGPDNITGHMILNMKAPARHH